MDIKFNAYGRAEPSVAYIAHPSYKKIGVLNGIQENTGKCEGEVNTATLSFTVDKYVDGKESNYYKFIEKKMKVFLTGTGWFTIDDIVVNNNDGKNETKDVSLVSIDQELLQHDLVGFKVNNGTTDSCEMLIEGNVEEIDGVEFAKKRITFHDAEDSRFSLLQTVLDWIGMTDWKVGYIDPVPKEFTVYENSEYIKKTYTLSEQIGYFNIDSSNAYDFLVKDASQYFECIFVFDILKKEINAYYAEHIGEDTNIIFGWRNLQKSNAISQDPNLFTRYTVRGGDDLTIYYANFGSSMIENLDYFLNEKYMPPTLVTKYKAWRDDVESKRQTYMDLTIKYNDNLVKISELKNRVPLDGCEDDFSKFSNDELEAAKDGYDVQIVGYESFYVDENGNFDIDALMNCKSDWDEYRQIKDVILPNIEIEYYNRGLPTSVGEKDYLDSYKTDWALYGVDELEIKISSYKDEKKLLEDGHYDIPYDEYYALSVEESNNHVPEDERKYAGHTQSAHERRYADYARVIYQLNALYSDSCAYALAHRKDELSVIETENTTIQSKRIELTKANDKKTWILSGFEPFTKNELAILTRLYNDTDYTNNNVIVVDNDTNTTTVNEQLRLYELSKNDLEIYSQPQDIYTSSVENFLSNKEYQNYIRDLKITNFIRVETTADTFVKLRIIKIGFNPFVLDDANFEVEFSNMVRTKSDRNDFDYMLKNITGGSKNSINGSSGSTNNSTETVQLTPGLLKKLFSNSTSQKEISNIINTHFNSLTGKYLNLDTVDTELVKAVDVEADNGFFQYLQTELISAGKIVAESGKFIDLNTIVAKIKNAIIGTSSTETGIVVRLTADNAVIDEAFIKEVISQYISVMDLKAGNINTSKFNLLSEDGSMTIVDNTQTFKDKNGNVRLQIGEDAQGNFSFVVYDATGQGKIFDQDGIKDSAITDGLIKNDMIADGTIGKEKVNWADAGASVDKDGNPVWNSAQITIDGEGIDVKFSSILNILDSLNERTELLESQLKSIDLMGEQAFISSNGIVSPSFITVFARCTGNVIADKWFLNDLENDDFISNDKQSIKIPSTYMLDKTRVVVKAQNDDGSVYDIFSISKIMDGNSVDPYTIILTNESVMFSVDSQRYPTTDQSYKCNVIVYKGTERLIHFTVNELESSSGITVVKENTGFLLSVNPTTKLNGDSGEFTVKINVDGYTFERPISWVTFRAVETEYSGSFTSSAGLIFDKSKLTENDITILTTHVYYNSIELEDSLYRVEWYQSKDNGDVKLISTSHTITINLNDFDTSNDIYFLFELYDKNLITDDGKLLTSENGYTLICS